MYPVFGGWVWGGGWLSQLGANSVRIGHGRSTTPAPLSSICRAA